MTKWMTVAVFTVFLVAAMRTGELWTVMILIPAFAWLFNWADSIEEDQ